VTIVSRRVSLPGVDELFGPGGNPGQRAESPRASSRATTTSGADAEVAEALETVRRLTAVEDASMLAAREAAAHLELPTPEVGSLVRWAVSASGAGTVVEIGAAGGLTGLHVLTALGAGGVLTSVEPDPDAHVLARKAFDSAGAGSSVRSIQGDPATLLSRLADHSYDLVILQAEPEAYPEHLARARTLLRPGGMLLARGALPAGEHAEPLTRFLHDLAEDDAFSASVLPLDDGIAIATRLPDGS
jgi:predicted O-methyltransferase YrrM